MRFALGRTLVPHRLPFSRFLSCKKPRYFHQRRQVDQAEGERDSQNERRFAFSLPQIGSYGQRLEGDLQFNGHVVKG